MKVTKERLIELVKKCSQDADFLLKENGCELKHSYLDREFAIDSTEYYFYGNKAETINGLKYIPVINSPETHKRFAEVIIKFRNEPAIYLRNTNFEYALSKSKISGKLYGFIPVRVDVWDKRYSFQYAIKSGKYEFFINKEEFDELIKYILSQLETFDELQKQNSALIEDQTIIDRFTKFGIE